MYVMKTGGYHTEDKCDPAYVSSPPSDEEFAANRKRKGITSLPDTIYLLDHYQESRHWSRKSFDDLLEGARKRGPKEMINAGWEFLAPAWRGGQDSAAYPASATTMLHLTTNFNSGANPRSPCLLCEGGARRAFARVAS